MADNRYGYQPPEIGGLDRDDGGGITTYGTEWVWETYYVAYVNGIIAADTVFITFNI